MAVCNDHFGPHDTGLRVAHNSDDDSDEEEDEEEDEDEDEVCA